MKNKLLFALLCWFTTSSYSVTILEFCTQHPEHKSVKIINQIFDQAKPRWAIVRYARLIVGKDKLEYNAYDLVKAFFRNAISDIGKGLGWDKKKMDEEFEVLLAELDTIHRQ